MTNMSDSIRYLILLPLVLFLVQPAAASPPWGGDCTALERIANILAATEASKEITEEDLELLIENLSKTDVVIVALSAYALGTSDRDHETIRLALTEAIERRSEGPQLGCDLGATFCRVALLELGLDHADKDQMLETYRPLLDSDKPCLRFWAARVLTDLHETAGVDEALKGIADSDTDLNNAARMLLAGHPLNPVVTPPAYMIIEGVIFGEMDIAPCFGLLGLVRPERFSRWKGDCDQLRDLMSILADSQQLNGEALENKEKLIQALQTPEPVVASLAAYILGSGAVGDEAIQNALHKRMELANGTGIQNEMPRGFCLFALMRVSSQTDEELVAKLQEVISESDNPYLLTLAMDKLISMDYKEELENRVKEQLSKAQDYTDSSPEQILYMLRYPDRPRVFTGPMEFQLVLRIIKGAPTSGLCEPQQASAADQENQ